MALVGTQSIGFVLWRDKRDNGELTAVLTKVATADSSEQDD
jgi:hypothetical protein